VGRSRLTTKDEFNCLFDLLVFVGEEDVFFDPTCRVRVRVMVRVRVRVKVGVRVRGRVRGRPNTVGARGRN
jgi:hypothetical protein